MNQPAKIISIMNNQDSLNFQEVPKHLSCFTLRSSVKRADSTRSTYKSMHEERAKPLNMKIPKQSPHRETLTISTSCSSATEQVSTMVDAPPAAATALNAGGMNTKSRPRDNPHAHPRHNSELTAPKPGAVIKRVPMACHIRCGAWIGLVSNQVCMVTADKVVFHVNEPHNLPFICLIKETAIRVRKEQVQLYQLQYQEFIETGILPDKVTRKDHYGEEVALAETERWPKNAKEVIKEQITAVAENWGTNYAKSGCSNRHISSYWKVKKAMSYKTDCCILFAMCTDFFAKYIIGHLQYFGDELQHAIFACKRVVAALESGIKLDSGKTGVWALYLIFGMNHHINAYTDCPPVDIHPDRKVDFDINQGRRDQQTIAITTLERDDDGILSAKRRRVTVGIENRAAMQECWLDYLNGKLAPVEVQYKLAEDIGREEQEAAADKIESSTPAVDLLSCRLSLDRANQMHTKTKCRSSIATKPKMPTKSMPSKRKTSPSSKKSSDSDKKKAAKTQSVKNSDTLAALTAAGITTKDPTEDIVTGE